MVGFGQLKVIQAAGLTQLRWAEEVQVGCLFLMGQYLKAQAVAPTGFAQEVGLQAAGI